MDHLVLGEQHLTRLLLLVLLDLSMDVLEDTHYSLVAVEQHLTLKDPVVGVDGVLVDWL